MNIVVFDTKSAGHHMEYLHHLYEMALSKLDDNFVFVVPDSFNNKKHLFDWKKSPNISFEYIRDSRESYSSILDLIINSWKICFTLRNIIKKYSISYVFAIELIHFYPFAPFLIQRHVKLSGIIYRIYLYKESEETKIKELVNKSKFWLMAKFKVFFKVFLLNDYKSAEKLNQIYYTSKFKGLPDPFVRLSEDGQFDFRQKYNIPEDAILFAHFGALDFRKGSLDILDALPFLTESQKHKYWFVFAGKVNDAFEKVFAAKCDNLSSSYNIICKNEFCSFEFLSSLCKACNAILAPYHETCLSSGMLGYASQFHKPVIAPNKNLIGYLVNTNRLGIGIIDTNPSSIVSAMSIIESDKIVVSDHYSKKNSVQSFIDVISTEIY